MGWKEFTGCKRANRAYKVALIAMLLAFGGAIGHGSNIGSFCCVGVGNDPPQGGVFYTGNAACRRSCSMRLDSTGTVTTD